MSDKDEAFYVIAGTYQEFKEYVRLNATVGHGYTYLAHDEQLRGLYRPTVILYGSYRNRADWSRMQLMILSRSCKVITEERKVEVLGEPIVKKKPLSIDEQRITDKYDYAFQHNQIGHITIDIHWSNRSGKAVTLYFNPTILRHPANRK